MKIRIFIFVLIVAIGLLVGPIFVVAQAPGVGEQIASNTTPVALKEVGVSEKLGEYIDTDLEFLDEEGKPLKLASFFTDGKPVLLNIVYYKCPNLCNLYLNGFVEGLKKTKWTAGNQFRVVTISMDARETSQLAKEKKIAYMAEYGRPEGALGWHFLTGTEANIKKIAEQVGFEFRWDEATQQFAHAAVTTILSPQGKVTRYIYGIQPEPQTIRLGLLEASQGAVGNVVDKIIMYCFHYDPTQSKYTLYVFNLMKIIASLFAVVMAIILVPYWMREGRRFGTT